MAQKYVLPTQKRNVLSPTLRVGKGWSVGELIQRYETGIRNAVRIVLGSLVYAPSAGSQVAWARTQPMSAKISAGLQESVRRSIALLVPDVTVFGIRVDSNQDTETRTIDIRWGIPESVSRFGNINQMAVGPVTTTTDY